MKNDHTQAMNIRKFWSGVVMGTNPRIPTMSRAMASVNVPTSTTGRRPNLSVARISVTDTTREMTARCDTSQRSLAFSRPQKKVEIGLELT